MPKSPQNILIYCREQGLRNAFEAMDSDQDGYVTLIEFKQLMTKWLYHFHFHFLIVAQLDISAKKSVSIIGNIAMKIYLR